MSDGDGQLQGAEASWYDSDEVFATQEDFHHELELLAEEAEWDTSSMLCFWREDGRGGMLVPNVGAHPSLWLIPAFEAVVERLPERASSFKGVGFISEGWLTMVDNEMEVLEDSTPRQESKIVSSIVGDRSILSTCGRDLEWITHPEGGGAGGRVSDELMKIAERIKENQVNGSSNSTDD